MSAGVVVSVNIVHEIRVDPVGDVGRTAIDKRPTAEPVMLRPEGPDGDTVMDRMNHGGYDQAVYAYASEDLSAWSNELGRTIVPGQFGENLTTEGLDITGAVVGSVWRIADARLQVRDHRTP
jgi:MOSC domain-containing protein YiiM